MAEEKTMENSGLGATGNFIHNYIQADLEGELNKIHTRFPPEPRLSAHWSRKIHLPELWSGKTLRRQMQPAF